MTRDGLSALFLGLLSDEGLDRACSLAYEARSEFCDEKYTRSGLRAWEHDFVNHYLSPGMRVLVSSAGGGREVLALFRLGFEVCAFECNTKIAAWGNAFLDTEGVSVRILPAAAGECPSDLPRFDAVIIGWASYHHIRPAERRIRFLRSIRAHIGGGGPVLLSYLEQTGPRSLRPSRWANRIRRLLGRAMLEPGDIFGPPPMHLFTREEIEAELQQAGFRLHAYGKAGYPYAVAVVV
jgi:hypothetical protein